MMRLGFRGLLVVALRLTVVSTETMGGGGGQKVPEMARSSSSHIFLPH